MIKKTISLLAFCFASNVMIGMNNTPSTNELQALQQTPIDQKVNAEQNQSCLSFHMPTFFMNWPHNTDKYLKNEQVLAAYIKCIKGLQAPLGPLIKKIEFGNGTEYSVTVPRARDASLNKRFTCSRIDKSKFTECTMYKEWWMHREEFHLCPNAWEKVEKEINPDSSTIFAPKAFNALQALHNLQNSSK